VDNDLLHNDPYKISLKLWSRDDSSFCPSLWRLVFFSASRFGLNFFFSLWYWVKFFAFLGTFNNSGVTWCVQEKCSDDDSFVNWSFWTTSSRCAQPTLFWTLLESKSAGFPDYYSAALLLCESNDDFTYVGPESSSLSSRFKKLLFPATWICDCQPPGQLDLLNSLKSSYSCLLCPAGVDKQRCSAGYQKRAGGDSVNN
jgi:hypothetical protein